MSEDWYQIIEGSTGKTLVEFAHYDVVDALVTFLDAETEDTIEDYERCEEAGAADYTVLNIETGEQGHFKKKT